MIITRTPFRVSFFGGGTDYPDWYERHGGAVLSTTINKFCYLTVRFLPPFFAHRHRISYRKIELCSTVDEIEHPAVRAVLREVGMDRGLEIHHIADLPARSGLGSSSAFTVGLLQACTTLIGRSLAPGDLAREAIRIEQEVMGECVGSQDQVSAAHGGFNHIRFKPGGDIEVRPVKADPRRLRSLCDHLMLFFTGISRTAAQVAASYVNRLDHLHDRIQRLAPFVDEGLAILDGGGDLADFGRLLHEAWQVKRSLSSEVSSPRIDALYERARAAGAVGGKLIGAGGGGFLLLWVAPEGRPAVLKALDGLVHVPFRFEPSGTRVVFSDREDDGASGEPAAPPGSRLREE